MTAQAGGHLLPRSWFLRRVTKERLSSALNLMMCQSRLRNADLVPTAKVVARFQISARDYGSREH